MFAESANLVGRCCIRGPSPQTPTVRSLSNQPCPRGVAMVAGHSMCSQWRCRGVGVGSRSALWGRSRWVGDAAGCRARSCLQHQPLPGALVRSAPLFGHGLNVVPGKPGGSRLRGEGRSRPWRVRVLTLLVCVLAYRSQLPAVRGSLSAGGWRCCLGFSGIWGAGVCRISGGGHSNDGRGCCGCAASFHVLCS
ncbi:hypothetical protein SAMN05216174_111124 [Actinokineospora iranica]|uniref:Uncharacterized protein n=1 Tax=Actinokineospora iranica TaxID=1271860 RepID=A0A1G6UWF6_9PSEU|nr:hypothetical protein SAMN05216174_111124 [Actinokineospora iranica]